jgi:hypothetical protein
MTRKSQRNAAPGLQYARMAIRIDNFSRNSKVLSPGAPYWSKRNGWNFLDKVGTGVPAAAVAAATAFARSLRFSCSANVADRLGLSAACRRRAATREDRIVRPWRYCAAKGPKGMAPLSKQIIWSFVTIGDEHRDLKSTVEPRRAQSFSRNNLLDVLMSRYPATGSAMAAQRRMGTS